MHRGFRIGLPKIHRQFRTVPPKMHRRLFRIGPPQVFLNLLPPEFHRRGILLTFAIMKEKQQNNLFKIECAFRPYVLTQTILAQQWILGSDEHKYSNIRIK